MKTTNGVVTKYVYGRGLIGEETNSAFKTYHFDCRGSTIAITDASGNITDTFAYDTYGKQISRTGTGEVIFGYNGRDGVVTDANGLVYMRARYYSPEMRRFIIADIVAGAISNAVTLNRFAYANGNPVSFVDPFGLFAMPKRRPREGDYRRAKERARERVKEWIADIYDDVEDYLVDRYNDAKEKVIAANNYIRDGVVDTYSNTKDFVEDTTIEVLNRTSRMINHTKQIAKKAAAKTEQFLDYGINLAKKYTTFPKI